MTLIPSDRKMAFGDAIRKFQSRVSVTFFVIFLSFLPSYTWRFCLVGFQFFSINLCIENFKVIRVQKPIKDFCEEDF